ncbi:hypothetical protein CLV88_11513 [Shimia abyssi]|uniref:Uncharacterized protein n=1 Tax=Shimia abyssi TaxID=1662395 RepID=A0A2P8F7G6_9RHOB|nr:hypothetical protein CLV88_11513 [Shimia abyssi]
MRSVLNAIQSDKKGEFQARLSPVQGAEHEVDA